MPTKAELTVEELRNQYNRINNDYDNLLDACDGDVELRKKVGRCLTKSLKNYLDAQNKILNKNDDEVKELADAADKATEEIDKALEDFQNIVETLKTITTILNKIGSIISILG